jgi:hypothetical protein
VVVVRKEPPLRKFRDGGFGRLQCRADAWIPHLRRGFVITCGQYLPPVVPNREFALVVVGWKHLSILMGGNLHKNRRFGLSFSVNERKAAMRDLMAACTGASFPV